jgi:hypothetical protein
MVRVLVTNHVLSGALIGHAAPNVLVAFGAGVLSHLVLDALPHWGETRPLTELMHIAVPDGLLGAGAMAAATVLTGPAHRARVFAGMAGAALLDMDKPSNVFFGFSPFPAAVDRFHQQIQRESPSRMPQELLVGAATALVLGALTRRRTR